MFQEVLEKDRVEQKETLVCFCVMIRRLLLRPRPFRDMQAECIPHGTPTKSESSLLRHSHLELEVLWFSLFFSDFSLGYFRQNVNLL